MKSYSSVVASGALLLAGLAFAVPAQAAAPGDGQVVVIQAVPGSSVDVMVDGETREESVEVGAVLGPYELSAGEHEITFRGSGDMDVTTSVEVKAGSSSDIVLHRPAELNGPAVVNTYATPRGPIGPDKARVLIAHTATVAPADVQVDGQTVFTNIANGEYAEADVPSGSHRVELLPTGQTSDPILGPLDVELAPRTVTMVYAVGSPTNNSMNVIVHTAALSSDGTVVPDTIDTGSAGLAADINVTTFGAPSTGGHGAQAGSPWWSAALASALLGVAVIAIWARHEGRRGQRRAGRSPGTQ
ncbi:DUF4397 domain-containing protein [Nocardioides sp.]|uniref:DUF4397 domain-containing protein n=1 Tax=Nocardioides sp. TaxID=35761 RepID=UPI003D0F7F18